MSVHCFKIFSLRPTILHRSLGRAAIVLGNPDLFNTPATFTISGVTRDSAGAALGNCDVHLFKTSDDSEVQQTVSNGSGVFAFNPVNNGNGPWYIVAYLPGSPDRAGTTVNTLTGS